MTTLTTERPYLALDELDRLIIDERIKNFLRYANRVRPQLARPKLTPPKSDTVSPLPEPTELDMSFIPKTDTQKRTHQPREKPKRQAPDHTLANRIAAFIAKHGPVTSADISQRFNLNSQRVSTIIASMQRRKRLFVVGYKKNEFNQTVKVVHTGASFVYVSPNMPTAEAATEEKRPAFKPPSVAAVDRGRFLVERNFDQNGIAMQVFEQLCLRPQSISELERFFQRNNSTIYSMLERMAGLRIVEKFRKEYNQTSGQQRALWGVVEDELPLPPPRVPPTPEAIEAGRAKILRGCLRKGGMALKVFDALCAADGPQTRGALQKLLCGHETGIDNALRTLEAFGLVVDLGRAIDNVTGHMSKLWDVKTEVQP